MIIGSKFFKPEDLPADMGAIAWWKTSKGSIRWQMSKSVRGAKAVSTRHSDSPSYGWVSIEPNDRTHGLMIW